MPFFAISNESIKNIQTGLLSACEKCCIVAYLGLILAHPEKKNSFLLFLRFIKNTPSDSPLNKVSKLLSSARYRSLFQERLSIEEQYFLNEPAVLLSTYRFSQKKLEETIFEFTRLVNQGKLYKWILKNKDEGNDEIFERIKSPDLLDFWYKVLEGKIPRIKDGQPSVITKRQLKRHLLNDQTFYQMEALAPIERHPFDIIAGYYCWKKALLLKINSIDKENDLDYRRILEMGIDFGDYGCNEENYADFEETCTRYPTPIVDYDPKLVAKYDRWASLAKEKHWILGYGLAANYYQVIALYASRSKEVTAATIETNHFYLKKALTTLYVVKYIEEKSRPTLLDGINHNTVLKDENFPIRLEKEKQTAGKIQELEDLSKKNNYLKISDIISCKDEARKLIENATNNQLEKTDFTCLRLTH